MPYEKEKQQDLSGCIRKRHNLLRRSRRQRVCAADETGEEEPKEVLMTSEAYNNFVRALENKSVETRRTYIESFKPFPDFVQLSPGTIISLEQKTLQHKIRDFLDALKVQGRSYSTINKAYWAIRTFLAANETLVNWDWIDLYKPKKDEKEPADRPYNHEELSSIMAACELRGTTALLCMASGGLRMGALPLIRIPDLTWIEQASLYGVHVYPGTDSHYYTFFTPQCSTFIDELKGGRDSGFLFVNKRDADLSVTEDAIISEIYDAAVKAGLRQVTNKHDRKEVQLAHGCRKFFRTQLDNAAVQEDMAERLMGHGKKLVKTYSIPQVFEWFVISQYQKAIQNLTV